MKPLPCPRPLRRPSLIPLLALAAALFGTAPAVWSKLPPPSAEAQAKAAEAKARAAHADKVAAYQTCKSMDHVVGVYQAALRKAGKPVPTPVETPPCTDPGAFVYTPTPPVAAATPGK
ncbi:MAG: hypothetical protein AMXMBFR78_02780 [Rubrivivax sp.]